MTDELKQWEYDRGYDKGRADGYSQAENDYHTQTEKDRQSSYDCGYQQGAREFAEWLCEKYSRIRQDSIGLEKFQNIYWKSIDEVLAEWQKGAENGKIYTNSIQK